MDHYVSIWGRVTPFRDAASGSPVVREFLGILSTELIGMENGCTDEVHPRVSGFGFKDAHKASPCAPQDAIALPILWDCASTGFHSWCQHEPSLKYQQHPIGATEFSLESQAS